MRKFIWFQVLLTMLQISLEAQSVPYTTSSVRGSTVITNYIDPNAGPATGPGLSASPLESRLNAPLGTPWNGQSNSGPRVTATYGPNSAGSPSMQPLGAEANSYAAPYDQRGGYLPPNQPLMPVDPTSYADLPRGFPGDPTYLFPGLVRYHIDQWVGSDYLYNLTPNVGVVVEVIQSGELPQLINSNLIKENISSIFAMAGINPISESYADRPPLPFFNLIIFISPVEENFAFSVTGRLFEGVEIPRLNFRLPGTFQAITWEKQEMVVTPANRLTEQLLFTSREIAGLFAERVNYFKRQKIEQDQQLKLRCPPAPLAKCKRPKSTF